MIISLLKKETASQTVSFFNISLEISNYLFCNYLFLN